MPKIKYSSSLIVINIISFHAYVYSCVFVCAAISSLPSSQLLHHSQMASGLGLANNMVHHHNVALTNGLSMMNNNSLNATNNNNNNTIHSNNNHTNNNHHNNNNNNNHHNTNMNHSHNNGLDMKKGPLSSNNSSSNSMPPSSPNHIPNVLTPGKICSLCALCSLFFVSSRNAYYLHFQIDWLTLNVTQLNV